jgi:surfeit locus 1 family protein
MYFRPSIKLTLVLLTLILVFARLGWWQLERKTEKRSLFEQFETAPVLGIGQALERGARFAHVEAYGRYDPSRHLLLDNKVFKGRAGVQVLTPFTLAGGTEILVNRGWLPLSPDRRSLPDVETDASVRTITGILNKPSTGGQRIGEPDILHADRWPQLVTYLDLDNVSVALGTQVEPWLLQLDPEDESGFGDRQWQPAYMGPEVHGAYALQWFSLAAAAFIIWIALGIHRARQTKEATK